VPTWEEVLAAVEADAERTAALLTSAAEPIASPPPVLPLAVLPPLDAMPPVPEQLRERIIRLRARIDELQDELAAALAEWPAPRRPAAVVRPAVVVAPAAPRFVDTRV
jgi:hypothetical protein